MRRQIPFLLAAMMPFACAAALRAQAVTPTEGPYKVIKSEKVGGAGGFDYVYADSAGRKLYIPRSNRVEVYDLDTLKNVGTIADANNVHGAAVDTASGHGFCSSRPVVMWDTSTLKPIKTIDVQGNPDGIFADASSGSIYVLSHSTPNVTVIDAKDGTVKGTIDIGGAPEQGVADGAGHLYICIENGAAIAVIDAKAMKMTGKYELGENGGGPAGLSIDPKNRVLFAYCREHQNCIVLNADTGKILKTLPTGSGVDSAQFNPQTMESFSSHGDGILTVIKENSPTDFAVEQQVQTKQGAKTCTLDTRTNDIFLITAERAPARAPAAAQPPNAGRRGGRGGRGGAMVPASFTILVVGK